MTSDKQTYYADASSWATSQSAAERRSRNTAWIVAAALGVVAVLEAIALMSLAPLKSEKVVPVLVDRQTGFVEVLRADGEAELRADTALTRATLAQYVQARETYNITTVGAEYRKVMLWSAGPARNSYAALMPAQNPESPLRLYPRSTIVQVDIESVSELSPMTALVRFTRRRRDGEAPPGPLNYYAAVVTYRYADAPLRVEDRLVNPLGFQVTRYQRDDEVAPAVAATAESNTASPAPPPGPDAAPKSP
jgi:type IV secretion system protein VirB8